MKNNGDAPSDLILLLHFIIISALEIISVIIFTWWKLSIVTVFLFPHTASASLLAGLHWEHLHRRNWQIVGVKTREFPFSPMVGKQLLVQC